MTVVTQIAAVILGPKLRSANVFQPYQGAVSVRLQDDIVELRGLSEAADRADADLKLLSRLDRRLPDLARGYFYVLLLERIDHVAGGETAARHTHRIEPQPHGVLALAENKYLSNSRHTLQSVFYVDVQGVAHEERAVAVVRRVHRRAEDKVLRRLGNRDAGGLDGAGKSSLGRVDAILNVYRCQVRVPIQVEGRGNRTAAVIPAG